ncbi:hypothetical protein KUTeg_000377 [Tegillarca granosa]|uniref:Uncharacterized protein n=1 Tax=Tegillarca granosa TaxID=220873 RepID=A0ABQ9FXD7_TEGGR|nr:hypothetical protein KUTeg_000377 [Tegillarca granosa]
MAIGLTTGVLGQTTVLSVVGGLSVTIVLIVLVVICVCAKKEKEKNENLVEEKRKSEHADLLNGKVDTEQVHLDVDTALTPLSNGQVVYDNNTRCDPNKFLSFIFHSGSLRVSPGSPHQTSQRKLPAPPPAPDGASPAVVNLTSKREDDDDDYDHLNRPNRKNSEKNRQSNYDHVAIDAEGQFKIIEGKSAITDDYYAEVKTENIYAGVKDEENDLENDDYARVKGVSETPKEVTKTVQNGVISAGIVDDTYSSVKDESKDASQGSAKDFDPYSKVKDDPYAKVKDDPYNKVKDGDSSQDSAKDLDIDDPYNKVKDDCDSEKSFDPYNKVKDDPYSRVKGDDPYNKMKGDDDPYNKVKGDDDPYNKVSGDDLDQDEGASGSIEDHYSKVDPNRKLQSNVTSINITSSAEALGGTLASSIPNANDEYAVVVKNPDEKGPGFSVITSNARGNVNEEIDPYTLPPEPPRRYGSEEIRDFNIESFNTPPQPSPRNSREIPATAAIGTTNQTSTTVVASRAQGETAESTKKKEPPYSKLTARESMASINARRALNTYETVAEAENFYATVRGNVPAPPSLDSLHSMTKQNPGGYRLSQNESESNNERYASVDHPKSPGTLSNPRLSANVTGARLSVNSDSSNPKSPFGVPGGLSSLGATGGAEVVLSPNYQTVKDYIPEDPDTDPNYESVEEAKSKIDYNSQEMKKAMMNRKIRTHVYEEVKPSPESTQVKNRVLRSHMYEDIDEVKEQKKGINRKSKDEEVWKRRSDVEK